MRVGFLSTFVATLALSYTCDGSNLSKSGSLSKREVVAGGTTLRILPLGDSITVGIQSSDSNGYRVGLQKNLAGSKLQFVGDLRNGTMSNDHNAGTYWNAYIGLCCMPNPLIALVLHLLEFVYRSQKPQTQTSCFVFYTVGHLATRLGQGSYRIQVFAYVSIIFRIFWLYHQSDLQCRRPLHHHVQT